MVHDDGSILGKSSLSRQCRISAFGQQGTWRLLLAMSALPPKADIRQHDWHVRWRHKRTITSLALRGNEGANLTWVGMRPRDGPSFRLRPGLPSAARL